ncbi:MAG: hypothetical protein ACRD4T_01965 [Candidatus Acidiferrales bacterium]
MPATIRVEKVREGEYHVTVEEAGERTTHQVALSAGYHHKLTGGSVAPKELIRRSFEFLLEHEPKESILGRFDLPVIARYFPEYEREIRRRLG